MHNEELQAVYSSPNITCEIKSKMMRLAKHVAQTEKKRNAHCFDGETYRGPLGKPKHRYEGMSKMDMLQAG
jgi:hypothetical protein